MGKEIVVGEIDWNDADASTGSQKDRLEIPFMKLNEGKNKIRVMSNPLQVYVHWVEANGKKRPFNSPVDDDALVKRLEEAGFPRKRQWYVKVLDRTEGEFKFLQIGPQILNYIKELYNEEDWGPVTKYDITVTKGKKGQNPLYNVVPSNKAPLEERYLRTWESFQDTYAEADVQLTRAAKPEWIYEFMGWDSSDNGSDKSEPAPKQASSEKKRYSFDD